MTRRLPLIYPIGLAAVIILSSGLFIGMLHQAAVKRQDERTEKTANTISDEVYQYANNKQSVPVSLAAAGIRKVPPTVTYQKLSRSSYNFCVVYRTAYVIPYHKGKNCQVSNVYIQPFIKNADGSYTVCGIKTNYYVNDGYVIPSTLRAPDVIDISDQIFIFSADSRAFNENCDELKHSDLHGGDKVDVFDITYPLDASGNITRGATSIFLKRT